MKTAACVTLLILTLFACSKNQPDAATTDNSTSGRRITPGDLNTQEYPNQSGRIFGSWQATENIKNKDGSRQISQVIKLYVGPLKSAIEVQCFENGAQIADMEGVVNSTADDSAITYQQHLDFQKDDLCNFRVSAVSWKYRMVTDTNHVQFNVVPPLSMSRTNESPYQN